MTEKQFWKTTPRKLSALMDVYYKTKGVKPQEDQNEEVFKQLMRV